MVGPFKTRAFYWVLRGGISAFVLITALSVGLRGQLAETQDLEFFETKIRPVLIEHCFACHGADSGTPEANLRLDSLQGMRQGGDNGSVLGDRKETESLLVSALQYDAFEMPPSGKLPAAVVADFQAWIERGTPAPESFQLASPHGEAPKKPTIDWQQAGKHWAFQPIQKVTLPEVADPAWRQHPIDALIYAKLAQAGVQPVNEVDRHGLLRRVYLNLIGLPPTVEEIQDFINDDSPAAFGRVVESLLDSPRYGERWGRHWLDVVRYADSNGADENHPYPFAWRYRNYVIDAFNRDMPFDDFLVEQLAGDLLEQTEQESLNNRRLIATSFLALGIKIDAEQDPEKKRADIIDEQLDTMGRAFLGMTIGCARCHDHKFDPISTNDYYGLSGILRSTKLQNRPLESAETLSVAGELKSIQMQINQLGVRELGRIRTAAAMQPELYMEAATEVRDWQRNQAALKVEDRLSGVVSGDRLQAVGAVLDRSEFQSMGVWLDAESFQRGEAAIDRENYGKGIGIVSDQGGGNTWVEFDFDLPESGIYQVEFRYAAENARPGKLSINGLLVNDDSMAKVTGGWFPDKQIWMVEGRYQFQKGPNTLRFEVSPNMSHLDEIIVAWVEPAVKADASQKAASGVQQTPEKIAQAFGVDRAALLAWAELLRSGNTDEPPTELARQLSESGGPLSSVEKAEAYFPITILNSLKELRLKQQALSQRLQELNQPQVMAVADDEISDAVVLVRGNHRNPGAVVPRRFLTIVAGEEQASFPTGQSGRLELARAITDGKNPLTARVIANRIWRWHFGRGLVESTDNFGLKGALPTHPELLDFLAAYLIENDWSIKVLQRLIVSSRVYQLDGRPSENQIEQDPENQLYGRWPSRRMEAEVLRDSLLKVAGKLELETKGATVSEVTTANPSPGNLAENRAYYEGANCRSVFLPIVRTNVFRFYGLFDFPNPAAPKGNRDSTTVPTQSLFLLNSHWVRQLANEWSQKIESTATTETKRVERLYLSGLGRMPSAQEVSLALGFIRQEPDAWPSLCHSILMLNEFLYIE